MSKYQECAETILKASGDILKRSEAETLLKRIDDEARRKKAERKFLQADEFVNGLGKQLAEERVLEKMQKQREVADTFFKRRALSQRSGVLGNVKDGYRAIMVGSAKLVRGVRNSVDYTGKAIMGTMLGNLETRIKSLGDEHWQIFTRGLMDRDVMRELYSIARKEPLPMQNKIARDIAQVIHDEINQTIVAKINRSGGWIRNLEGYIARQSHSPERMLNGGFGVFEKRFSGERLHGDAAKKAWIDYVLPRLDGDKTFQGANPLEFLSSTYDALVTGVHLKHGEDVVDGFGIGKKIGDGNHRKLHFKDADSFFDYNQKFGTGNLRESIFRSAEHGGKTIALLDTFGVNPRATHEWMMNKINLDSRENPTHGLFDSVKDFAYNPETLFRTISGESSVPVNSGFARHFAGYRALQSMAKLGGAAISSIPDLANAAHLLSYRGMPLVQAYYDVFSRTLGLHERSAADMRSVAAKAAVSFEAMKGHLASNVWAEDSLPGFASKLQNTFFTANGLNWWTERVRMVSADIIASDVGNMASKSWNDIAEHQRGILSQYDIKQHEWETLRKYTWKDSDGTQFLTADRFRDIDKMEIGKLLEADGKKITDSNIARKVDELQTKFNTMYLDQVEQAALTPSAKERSILLQGTNSGTVQGELLRLVAQFKSFPLSVATKVLPRELAGYAGGKLTGKGVVNLAGLIASQTILGLGAMYFKDIARGKQPRPVDDPRTWVAAMTQGGGMGIYGDFLFNAAQNRYGQSLVGTLAGPTWSNAESAGRVFSNLVQGKADKAGDEFFDLFKSNTPFVNLFYTRAALDYLVLYHIQEALNPGYLQRLEERSQEQEGRGYWLPPTSIK